MVTVRSITLSSRLTLRGVAAGTRQGKENAIGAFLPRRCNSGSPVKCLEWKSSERSTPIGGNSPFRASEARQRKSPCYTRRVKKQLALLPTAALFLAACNPTSTPTVDPLTRTFTGTGAMTNFTPGKEYSLTIPSDTSKRVVGTLTVDKAVSVSITAETMKALSFNSIQKFYDSVKNSGCDVSKLQIINTEYVPLSSLDFTTASGLKSYVEMSTETPNADGTLAIKKTIFYYSKGSGEIKGTLTCPGYPTDSYNMTLKPGWNEISRKYTYNPTNKTFSGSNFDTVSQKNSYSGEWRAFAR